MKPNRWLEIVGALFLIGAGVAFLLQNLNIFSGAAPLVWSLLFMAGGALFLLGFATDRSQWWPLIPGFALLGVGLAILLPGVFQLRGEWAGVALFLCLAAPFGAVYLRDRRENWWALIPAGATALLALVTLMATVAGELAGAIFFLGLGAIFLALYFAEIGGQRHNWWALIPAGALLSLAAVIILASYGLGGTAGATLFLGLGLTFGALYLLPGRRQELQWAWIPSVALLGFGAFVLAVAGDFPYARLFWPLLLVVAGLVLVFVQVTRRAKT